MVCSVVWLPAAITSYIDNINYLEKDWSAKEVQKFKTDVLRIVDILSKYPRLGKLTGRRNNVRRILVHKKISLFYKYN